MKLRGRVHSRSPGFEFAAGSNHGPAITEIDSPNLRGGHRLIAEPLIESRVSPRTSRPGNQGESTWATWECRGKMGIGLGFPGTGPVGREACRLNKLYRGI